MVKKTPPLIQELKKERKKEDKTKTKVIEKLLQDSINSIKTVNLTGYTHTIIQIPMFSLGYPLYDISEMTALIEKKLKKQGFETRIIKTDTIFVKW